MFCKDCDLKVINISPWSNHFNQTNFKQQFSIYQKKFSYFEYDSKLNPKYEKILFYTIPSTVFETLYFKMFKYKNQTTSTLF